MNHDDDAKAVARGTDRLDERPDFRARLLDKIKSSPELRETAESLLAGSLREMATLGGSELGLMVVYVHALGQIGALYAQDQDDSAVRAALFSAISASMDEWKPIIAGRKQESPIVTG